MSLELIEEKFRCNVCGQEIVRLIGVEYPLMHWCKGGE